MENNQNKKSVKFQGRMFHFCDFIQVFVFTRNHHLKKLCIGSMDATSMSCDINGEERRKNTNLIDIFFIYSCSS